MEKRCVECVHFSVLDNSWCCAICREDKNKPNWKEASVKNLFKYIDIGPDVETMHKKSLNYLYGSKLFDEVNEYCKKDMEATMEMFMAGGRSNGKTLRTLEEAAKKIGCRVVAESWFNSVNMPGIEKVIFSGPCTIVLWDDNTKTIVRAQGDDVFDPEKGLAMAISKKALGNKGNYFDEFKKWLPEEVEEKTIKIVVDFDGTALRQACMDAGMTAIKEKDDEWKRAIAEYLLGKCEKE